MATQRVLRRFPYQLNLGTDICHVVRIRSILASPRGGRFVHRILTADERRHPKIHAFLSRQDTPQDAQHLEAAATFVAGRFAAKEAVIKAHPHRSLTWHEIVITSRPSSTTTPTPPDNNNNRTTGAPTAIIRGATEDYEALLSISHDGEYATAVCLGAPET